MGNTIVVSAICIYIRYPGGQPLLQLTTDYSHYLFC